MPNMIVSLILEGTKIWLCIKRASDTIYSGFYESDRHSIAPSAAQWCALLAGERCWDLLTC